MFKTDKSSAYGLKAEGKYEAIITRAEKKNFRSGKSCISFTLTIRNDVDQKYSNGSLFYSVWPTEEPTKQDKAVGGYSFSRLMSVGFAAGLEDGKEYEDLETYLQDLVGRCVKANVVHREGNDGVEREVVNYLAATDHPECKHKFKAGDAVNMPKAKAATPKKVAEPVEADGGEDDDYPF